MLRYGGGKESGCVLTMYFIPLKSPGGQNINKRPFPWVYFSLECASTFSTCLPRSLSPASWTIYYSIRRAKWWIITTVLIQLDIEYEKNGLQYWLVKALYLRLAIGTVIPILPAGNGNAVLKRFSSRKTVICWHPERDRFSGTVRDLVRDSLF